MAVKPYETVRTFTVERKWSLTKEDIEALICKHLGIPYDNSTYIDLCEFGATEIRRIEIDRQTA